MGNDLLRNGGFEADWEEERSHRCLVSPVSGPQTERDIGNVFTPPGWLTWFRHQPGLWDQPEVRDARATVDARRVHSGQKGMLLFTFYRKHDGGFLQRVQVVKGTRVRLSAWAHAWSNCQGRPNTDDPRWSEGPGYAPGFLLEGEQPPAGSPGSTTDWQNFTFRLGIDPRGGTDPSGASVVWGRGAHIYNQYAEVPPVEVVAEADQVTVFLRSTTLWPFKHNDAYWDDAALSSVPAATIAYSPLQPTVGNRLEITATFAAAEGEVALLVTDAAGASLPLAGPEVVSQSAATTTLRWSTSLSTSGEHRVRLTAAQGTRVLASAAVSVAAPAPPPECIPPRVPYARVYVLFPQDAGPEWVEAVLKSGRWERNRWTVGCSADDAGVGPRDRTVIAINPGRWPSDLRAFFEQYYPGVRYTAVEAGTPAELEPKLRDLELP
jgi:hypothetical protein